jgi:hypothetical protein
MIHTSQFNLGPRRIEYPATGEATLRAHDEVIDGSDVV